MKDLVVLVADKNAHFSLKGALSRHEALGIPPIDVEFLVHVGRDGGARKSGPELLALQRPRFSHALLVLDFEGCGTDLDDAHALEAQLDQRLQASWANAAKSIVIEPEVDVWMWGSDNSLRQVIDWTMDMSIRGWVEQQGFQLGQHGKPDRPKEAIEAVLRQIREPRSSALYERIARQISLKHCADGAFHRLRAQLAQWFPNPP